MSNNEHYISCPQSKIRIGPRDYQITYMDDVDVDISQRVGWCDSTKLVIRIFKSTNKFKVAETFIHEILHAIENVMCIDKRTDDDGESSEKNIQRLTTGLVMFIKYNPLVVVWLLYLLTEFEIFNITKYKLLSRKPK